MLRQQPLHVLRLCSVFEPPDACLDGRGARFDPLGGMQNHTGNLVRQLDDRGVRQTVVTTRPPGAPAHQLVGAGASIHRFGLPVRLLRQGYAAPAALAVPRLACAASLVHCHLGEDLAAGPIALAAARRHDLPLVVTLHTSLAHTFHGPGVRGAALRHAGGRIERRVVHAADAVIVLTARTRRLLAQDGVDPAKIHVIPSGTDPAAGAAAAGAADPLDGAGRPRVVFVGRLAHQKGVRTLVEAAALLRTPGARVALVGDGPERAAVEELVRARGIEDRVHLHGFVPHDLVPSVLAGADVQVMPSVYEELGSALLEGLQAGAAIVASDTGGIPEAVGDAAVLVPPGDPVALARALDDLLADPARRAELAAAALQRATGFGWPALARRVLEVYRQVTGTPAEAARTTDTPVLPSAVA